MQASRASAAPREQAARILKNGRQAAHSAPPTLRRKQIPADKQKMNQAQSLAVLRPIHI